MNVQYDRVEVSAVLKKAERRHRLRGATALSCLVMSSDLVMIVFVNLTVFVAQS